MNVQSIINRARRMTYTNSVQYTNNDAIEDFNIIYHELCNAIMNEVNEGYFWDEFTANTVIGQNEYTLPSGFKKLEEVYVQYSTGGNIRKVQLLDNAQLNKDTEELNKDINTTSPIGYIKDNSVFIFPAPTEVVTDGVKLKGTIMPSDLLITDSEEDILIDREFHHILSTGMEQFMFTARGKINEKNDAINEYKMRKSEMIFDLSDRQGSPTNGLLPNLDYYG